MLEIGDVRIIPILDATTEVEVSSMYEPGANIDEFKDFLTSKGLYAIPMGGFFVEKEDKKILIDAGQGLPAFTPAFGHMMEDFKKYNIQLKKISDIIITHAHVDHVGWLSTDGKSNFPNAKIWIHQKDIEFSLQNNASMPGCVSAADRLAPVKQQICPIDSSEITILPGVTLRHAPGHTPGELLVDIETSNKRVLLLGDVFHHPAEIVDKSWIFNAPGSDFDPKMAKETRMQWIKELYKPNTIITAAHFPDMHFGHVEVSAKGSPKWVRDT